MKNNIFFILTIFLLLSSCGDSSTKTENNQPKEETTTTTTPHKGQASVVDEDSEANALQVAKSLPDNFSTLVAAIEAAGVEDAVVNAGPLTIFAPTNDAFGKLPEGTVETLVKPENKATLAHILTYHVAAGNYHAKQLAKEAKKGRKIGVAAVQNGDVLKLAVEEKEDGLYIQGTKILQSVKVSNGWIHVIGDVLLPPEEGK